MIRGNHDHWLAMYILKYFAATEKKRSKVDSYPYNSFDLLKERLTLVDMKNLADKILEWPMQQSVEVGGEKYLLAHAMTSDPTIRKTEDYFLMGAEWDISYCVYGIEGYVSVCGHRNTDDGRIWKDKRGNLYMIDCGCGFRDGNLGCLCLETKEEFYL